VELKAQKLKAQRTFMQISFKPTRQNKSANALLIVMCSLAAMLLVFASMMYWMSGNSKLTARNNQFNMSEAAAEAAVEEVLSQMNYDYVMQSLSNSDTYYSTQFLPSLTNEQANWPVQYVYSDTNGNQNQISVVRGPWTTNTVPLTSQYTNLYGLKQDCTITATATPIGQSYNVPATVCETVQFAAIPLFQFAVFYNMDLEIDPGAAMTVVGAVWSNGGIWSGTPNVSYSSTVGAVGKVYYHDGVNSTPGTDPFCTNKVDSGGVSSGTPSGNFTYTPTSSNDRITMPIGTNNDPATVAALIGIPPAPYTMNTANAYTTNGLVYFANAADLYLTNFSTGIAMSGPPKGTNMILYYQDVNQGAGQYQTQLPYDFYVITNTTGTNHRTFVTNYVATNILTSSTSTNINITNIWYAGYSWLTNVYFVDWREGWNSGSAKTVQTVQIDLQQFNIWLTNSTTYSNGGSYYNNLCNQSNHKSHPIDSIYIYNGVLLTGTVLPGVRVKNGGMLPTQTAPKGFTVATAMPLYVYGDYNASNTSGSSLGKNSTSYTWPAGLIGDSITILSDNWNDSTFTKLPTPTTTTVNAAMVEGIVRSTNGIYCGGLENFLRLLENWSSSIPLWYNGSIVVMFPSQIATNYQQPTGNYYNAPKRNWAFDTNFNQQVGLPPLTPQAKGVIRTNWIAY
jgi:hypothetical protein